MRTGPISRMRGYRHLVVSVMWAGWLTGHKSWVENCSFSCDLTRLASCSGDGTVRVWDVVQQRCLFTLLGHKAEVWSCHWHPKRKDLLCSSSSDRSVIVWDVEKQKALFSLEHHQETVWCCRFSPDGDLLVSTSSDKTVSLWCCDQIPVHKPKLLVILEKRGDALEFAEFSPDSRLLCTVCRDGKIRLWKLKSTDKRSSASAEEMALDVHEPSTEFRNKKTLQEASPVCECPWSGDVVCETSHSTLYITLYCQLKRRKAWVRACAFSPVQSHLLATCSNDGHICIWDTNQRSLKHELFGHRNIVWSCVFLQHKQLGLLLLSCSSDQTLRSGVVNKFCTDTSVFFAYICFNHYLIS
jgi:WD40 repeat protein